MKGKTIMNTTSFIDPLAKLLGDWSSELSFYSILFRFVISILFASLLGWERSNKRHSAGLRTFILITLLGTVCAVLDLALVKSGDTSLYLFSGLAILGGVVISGNSILFSAKKQIKGLTTSVALWLCLLLGIVIGLGYYLVAIVLAALMLVILIFFPMLEIFLKNKSNHFEIHLELKDKTKLQDIVFTLRKLDIRIDDLELNSAYLGTGLSVYTLSLTLKNKKAGKHKEIVEALSSLDYVSYVEEI